MQFSKELIEKASAAASAEDLLEIAKADGIELSAEEAEQYFEFLHSSGSLSEEELERVAGGKGNPPPKYKIGQRVRYIAGAFAFHGEIVGATYSESYGTWKYMVRMKDGRMKNMLLESPDCYAKVLP